MSGSAELPLWANEFVAHVRRAADETGRLPNLDLLLPLPKAPRPAAFAAVRTHSVAADEVRSAGDLAPFIDHTLLKPESTRAEVIRVAEEARTHGFATVCVNAWHVPAVARVLEGSRVLPIAVVGFPLGAALPQAKALEAKEAVALGAREIDTVLNVGALRGGEDAYVYEDILRVVEAAAPHPVKVILETSLLRESEKIIACALASAAGAAFVKTSTGFSSGGATVEDVMLMRRVVGEDVGVKASGGIRSAADALKMVRAGANRLGASASVAIVQGGQSSSRY